LIQPSELGLTSITANPEINIASIESAYQLLRGPKEGSSDVTLSWWVHPKTFKEFRRQPTRGVPDAKKFPLRQRVIKIPINTSPVAKMHLGHYGALRLYYWGHELEQRWLGETFRCSLGVSINVLTDLSVMAMLITTTSRRSFLYQPIAA
jgi:hypothetical protein